MCLSMNKIADYGVRSRITVPANPTAVPALRGWGAAPATGEPVDEQLIPGPNRERRTNVLIRG